MQVGRGHVWADVITAYVDKSGVHMYYSLNSFRGVI